MCFYRKWFLPDLEKKNELKESDLSGEARIGKKGFPLDNGPLHDLSSTRNTKEHCWQQRRSVFKLYF